MRENNISNSNLLWESNNTLNVGIDIGIIDKIDLSLEVYNRVTKDLLMDLPISLTTGFSSFTTNIGNVRNSGIELSINSSNIQTKNMLWTSQFNISHNKSEIIRIDGVQEEMKHSWWTQEIGKPYYQFYVIEYSHVNPDNGRAMFFMNDLDANGARNRTLTDDPTKATAIAYKSPFPKVSLGLSNSFRWKFLDLNFTLSSTLGGYSYDGAASKTQTSGSGDGAINQIPVYYRDSWKQPGDNAKYEAWIYGNSNSSMPRYHNSRRIHSTDHVRLKNLTFGVSLPSNWVQKLKMNQARIYFTGHNLFTLAAFDEYDPEVPNDGWVGYNSPALKSYSIGININF